MKRIAIITGASSGIGREFVRAVDRQEKLDEIWAVARRKDRLEMLAGQIETPLRPLAYDLLQEESMEKLEELLQEEKPEVAILVNASGFGKYGTYKDLTKKEINDMLDLNCKALVHLTYLCLPFMKKGSRVLNMGSLSAFQPLPYFNLYASTKAFVVHFSRALNMEVKDRGISVTCICPGYVKTEFIEVAKRTKNPDACQHFWPIYEAPVIVKKALRDSKRGRDMSVYGFTVNLIRFWDRILPHPLVMRVWIKVK